MAGMRSFEVTGDKINVYITYKLLTLYVLRKNEMK